MRKIIVFIVLVLAPALAFAQFGTAKKFRRGGADPSTCDPGDVFFNTTTGKYRSCVAADTWGNLLAPDASGNYAIGATVLDKTAGLTAQRVTSSLAYNQTTTLAVAGSYATISTGAGNWRGSNSAVGSRECITLGQKWRVRQTGLIRRVRFFVSVKHANYTAFYVKVWRYNGATYDLKATTENLLASMSDGTTASITLTTPLAVQEGDYVGYRMEHGASILGGNTYLLTGYTGQAGVTTYSIVDGAAAGDGTNWPAQTASAGVAVPVLVDMYAPAVVSIGDSITAGHPAHYAFTETTATTDFTSEYPRLLGQMLGWPYQNMGIGSETCANLATRFAADVVALAPKVATISCGVNDIATSVPQATTITNMTAMLAAAQAASIKPVIVLVAPWTAGTTGQMQARDALNAALVTLAGTYNAITVNLDAYLGQFRAGGDANNLWDIQASYNAGDNVHFNAAGYQRIATAIYDAIRSLVGPIDAAAFRSRTGMQDVSVDPKPVCDVNTRGTYYVEKGAAGVLDHAFLCVHKADNTYAWGEIGLTIP